VKVSGVVVAAIKASAYLGHEVRFDLGAATTADRVAAKLRECHSQVDAWRMPSLMRAEVINKFAHSLATLAAFAPIFEEQIEDFRRLLVQRILAGLCEPMPSPASGLLNERAMTCARCTTGAE